MREFRRRPGEYLHQRWIPEGRGKIDALLLHRSAIIKRPRIAEISYRPRPSQNFQPLTGTDRRRISRCPPVKEIAHTQAAVHRAPFGCCLYLFEIDVVANAPWQHQRVGAKNSSPAQRFVKIQSTFAD